MKKDNKIFDKIVTKMNKYGNSISKNSEKVIQTAINSSEKLAKKGKITLEIEKLNIELKKYYYDLGKYISTNCNTFDFTNDEKFILMKDKIDKLKLLIDERKKVRRSRMEK
tara:strand:+ start:48 stop:380 length:333 start_codon:yes stop_codon:yes gene_type:complete